MKQTCHQNIQSYLIFTMISCIVFSCASLSSGQAIKNAKIQTFPPALTPAADMILVPSGTFIMGATRIAQEEFLRFGWSPQWIQRVMPLVKSSGPAHEIFLDSFYIYQHEVTNRQYKAFVDATGHSPPRSRSVFSDADQPVVGVSWYDAQAFCEWAGARLPTEAEWEKAARGSEGFAYPWGNRWDANKLQSADRIAKRPLINFSLWSAWQQSSDRMPEAKSAKVGSFSAGASPYGVMDMAGNVWEWVADWYAPHYYVESPKRNPQGPSSGERRVLRGGAWDVPKAVTYTWYRETFMPPSGKSGVTGFRCAISTSKRVL